MTSRDFLASEGYTLPTDFNDIVDLYHDGSTYYGPVKIVSAMELSDRKGRHGDTGVPRWAAVIDEADGAATLRFAPEPDSNTAYSLRLVYNANIEALSASNTSNWLLAASPDIYLFASLAEAEAFLQEDQRVGMWLQRYEQAVMEFDKNKKRRAYGGPLTPRPRHIIGEGVSQ